MSISRPGSPAGASNAPLVARGRWSHSWLHRDVHLGLGRAWLPCALRGVPWRAREQGRGFGGITYKRSPAGRRSYSCCCWWCHYKRFCAGRGRGSAAGSRPRPHAAGTHRRRSALSGQGAVLLAEVSGHSTHVAPGPAAGHRCAGHQQRANRATDSRQHQLPGGRPGRRGRGRRGRGAARVVHQHRAARLEARAIM